MRALSRLTHSKLARTKQRDCLTMDWLQHSIDLMPSPGSRPARVGEAWVVSNTATVAATWRLSAIEAKRRFSTVYERTLLERAPWTARSPRATTPLHAWRSPAGVMERAHPMRSRAFARYVGWVDCVSSTSRDHVSSHGRSSNDRWQQCRVPFRLGAS